MLHRPASPVSLWAVWSFVCDPADLQKNVHPYQTSGAMQCMSIKLSDEKDQ